MQEMKFQDNVKNEKTYLFKFIEKIFFRKKLFVVNQLFK